jgi:hypothetical protein
MRRRTELRPADLFSSHSGTDTQGLQTHGNTSGELVPGTTRRAWWVGNGQGQQQCVALAALDVARVAASFDPLGSFYDA